MAEKKKRPPNKGIANLRPLNTRPPEEALAIRRKGAAAVNAKAKAKRTLRQSLEWLLSEPMFETENDAVNAIKEKFPDMTNGDAMNVALLAKTVRDGDAKTYTAIRDTVGEMPSLFGGTGSDEPITINIKVTE